MSFKKGKINATAFRIPDYQGSSEIHEEQIEAANAHRAIPLANIQNVGEPSIGWVSGSVVLHEEITQENSICGGWLYLNYRKAEKKINNELFKATCEKDEYLYLENNPEIEYVSARVRREIKEAALINLSKAAALCVKAIPVVIKDDFVFIGATGEGEVDAVRSLLLKTFEIEPYQINGTNLAILNQKTDSDFTMGREFLTWLYWQKGQEISKVEFTIEGPLDFISDASEKGCTNAITKGELAPIARESRIALQEDKLLRKAVLSVVDGDDVYSGTFDADKFAFSSLELPVVDKGTPADEFTDRMELLVRFFNKLEDLFIIFIVERSASDYQENFQQWIQNN